MGAYLKKRNKFPKIEIDKAIDQFRTRLRKVINVGENIWNSIFDINLVMLEHRFHQLLIKEILFHINFYRKLHFLFQFLPEIIFFTTFFKIHAKENI